VNARRPKLREVPLADVLPLQPGVVYVTCSPGQWDHFLQVAYEANCVLLEVDEDEDLVAAYRRPPVGWN
jgi:hypothetical protein